jgi:hypothetical protein
MAKDLPPLGNDRDIAGLLVLMLFHFGPILAKACGTFAAGSMIQSLLHRGGIGLPALLYFQHGLLDRSGKRESQYPGLSCLESEIHRIQPGGGHFIGLTSRQEGNPGYGRRDGSEKAGHGGIGHLLHTGLLGANLLGPSVYSLSDA